MSFNLAVNLGRLSSRRNLTPGRGRGSLHATPKSVLGARFSDLRFPPLKEPGSRRRPDQGVTLSQVSHVSGISRAHLHSGTANMKSLQVGQNGLNRSVVAFGSNMGDRIANIEAALYMMRKRGLRVTKLSSLYETKPMYYDDQDPFLNGVCQIETDLEPLQLLDVLQSIENDLGRRRVIEKGPRTIDLDIILYNNDCIRHARLNVPHSLLLEREFVLRPLAE